ncbi:MAG: enoyl-CoA hydratase-related protein [Acidimicrobiales bacterium]
MTKPTIGAINGAAAGIGLVLACYLDIRFAAKGAKFTTAHGKLNLPVEAGLSWLLPRIVGLGRANELLFTSRPFLAEEAERIGLVNAVCEPDALLAHTYSFARELLTNVSPRSLRETKRQIYTDLHRDVGSSVRDADQLVLEMVKEPAFNEGVAALVEKRPRTGPGRDRRGPSVATAVELGQSDAMPAKRSRSSGGSSTSTSAPSCSSCRATPSASRSKRRRSRAQPCSSRSTSAGSGSSGALFVEDPEHRFRIGMDEHGHEVLGQGLQEGSTLLGPLRGESKPAGRSKRCSSTSTASMRESRNNRSDAGLPAIPASTYQVEPLRMRPKAVPPPWRAVVEPELA